MEKSIYYVKTLKFLDFLIAKRTARHLFIRLKMYKNQNCESTTTTILFLSVYKNLIYENIEAEICSKI